MVELPDHVDVRECGMHGDRVAVTVTNTLTGWHVTFTCPAQAFDVRRRLLAEIVKIIEESG